MWWKQAFVDNISYYSVHRKQTCKLKSFYIYRLDSTISFQIGVMNGRMKGAKYRTFCRQLLQVFGKDCVEIGFNQNTMRIRKRKLLGLLMVDLTL
jgi:hypothetical protein